MGRREGSEQRIHGPLVRTEVTICLVTDRRRLSPEARTTRDEVLELGRWLEQAVAAGVDLIQLRERDLPARALADLARAVMASARGSSTRVVVNDRADVAIACDCDGVHLRGDGPPISRVRTLTPRGDFLVGRSIHSVEEATTHADADYLLFGSVFDSGDKPGRGLDALRSVTESARRGPGRAGSGSVIAIGGITVPRAAQCIAAGAAGVAAIRLFLPPERAEGALGVPEACARLRGAIDAAVRVI